jgi:hypothetical protein
METLGNQIMPKLCSTFYCKYCDYRTSKKSSYANHTMSAKHIKSIKVNALETFGNTIMPKLCSSNYTCEKCKKEFKNRSGLWKHNSNSICSKKDENLIVDPEKDESTDKQLIMMLIKKNDELQNMILEVIKNGTHNNTTNNTNISNKSFNLNLFLNETCKDAMNIMDFVESIKLQLSDLERVGEFGYVEGISNIIVKKLKELDITQRPVHCTDKKRETMYIKHDNKWEKDDNNIKMHKVVRKVADKNARMILKYKEVHPDCGTYHSKFSDQYNKIIVEAMGGSGDNDFEKEEKIIRNVSKQIGIEKS